MNPSYGVRYAAFGLLLLILVASPVDAQSKLRLKEKTGDTRTYAGHVRLSGEYAVYYDGSDFDGVLSFAEDKASRRKLPSNEWREGVINLRSPRGEAYLMRLFSIPATREQEVCGYEGRATIDIKDFIAVKAGSETGDGATLVRISRLTKPKRIPCKKSAAGSGSVQQLNGM